MKLRYWFWLHNHHHWLIDAPISLPDGTGQAAPAAAAAILPWPVRAAA